MTSEILMAVSINIAVVYYVTFNPEDIGSKFVRNICTCQTARLHIPEKVNLNSSEKLKLLVLSLFQNCPHRLPQFPLKFYYQSLWFLLSLLLTVNTPSPYHSDTACL
jgi:hypothetical protein